MSLISYLIFVALCAACISYTITFAGIFNFLREWIEDHFGNWFSELIHCPYCFGHYVVLIIMFTTKNLSNYLIPITSIGLYNFLFTWFVIVCIMSLLHFIMTRAYGPVAEVETFRKKKKLKIKNGD